MTNQQRLQAFSVLGKHITQFLSGFKSEHSSASEEEFLAQMRMAEIKNPWFTQENILWTLENWSEALKAEKLENWTKNYSINENSIKNIGIVCAGNIPMVGFHDILSVLVTGNLAQIKLSSKDEILTKYLLNYLMEIEPNFKNQIQFTEKLQNYDAVIATGSDNTARYFEAYFGKFPHIIRKNRTSVAVVTGNESEEDLKNLGKDIFTYYGLGCRNVTQLLVPKNYNFNAFFEAIFEFKDVINHHKYANNYDYHRAIYLMKNEPILDNNFLILKKDDSLYSPLAVLFYEEMNVEEIDNYLEKNQEKIQCVVGKGKNQIPFGEAQNPELLDYADGVDTLEFLVNL